MNFPESEVVVTDIAGNQARLVCTRPAAEARLLALGFTRQGVQWVRPVADDADRKALVDSLDALGALFSAGPDWSPAQLAEHYREQGVISAYRSISWREPGQYSIASHTGLKPQLDAVALRQACQVLAGLLQKYAASEPDAGLCLRELAPLFRQVTNGEILQPWKQAPPCGYYFVEGSLREYPELERAYAAFSMRLQGWDHAMSRQLVAEAVKRTSRLE